MQSNAVQTAQATPEPRELATRIRAHVLRLAHRSAEPWVGPSLSLVDVLTVLYGGAARIDPAAPRGPERDRVVLSDRRAAFALYATLTTTGFFPATELRSLAGRTRAEAERLPGIELASRGPAHGFAVAVGLAVALRRAGGGARVFVLTGEVEGAVGLTWESAALAAELGLDNLVVVVNDDRTEDEAADRTPPAERWQAHDWATRSVDGHDYKGMHKAFSRLPWEPGRPSALVSKTLSGAGVSFMESDPAWRERAPDAKQLQQALAELKE